MSRIVVLDVETTGLNTLRDDPIQIAYVAFDGQQKIDEKEIFLKTSNLPPQITEITGITQATLDEKGIDHDEAVQFWADTVMHLDPDVLVGHNLISFDLMLLTNWMTRTVRGDTNRLPTYCQIYDTMTMAKKILGLQKRMTLKTLAERLEIVVDESQLHNALYDIDITAKVYFALLEKSGVKASAPSNGPQQLLF